MREDGPLEGKMRQISITLFLLSPIFPCTVEVAPDVGFDDLGVPGKLAMSSLECHNLAGSRAWACEIYSCEQRPPGRFSLMESHFPTEISA